MQVHVIRPKDLTDADLALLRRVGYQPPLARRISQPRMALLPK